MMKKLIAALLVCGMLFSLTACDGSEKSEVGGTDASSGATGTTAPTETEGESEADMTESTTEAEESYESVPVETQEKSPSNELSDELAVKIAENCFLTISAEFEKGDVVPYSDIFNYYRYDGCLTSDGEGIPMEIVPYFDSQNLKFSVPYEMVDTFLSGKFNTVPDRNAIECYDSQTQCYEFEQHFGENYYEFTLADKEKHATEDGVYRFAVKIRHSLTDEIPAEYHSFVIELKYNDILNEVDYKILSRKIYSEQEYMN